MILLFSKIISKGNPAVPNITRIKGSAQRCQYPNVPGTYKIQSSDNIDNYLRGETIFFSLRVNCFQKLLELASY